MQLLKLLIFVALQNHRIVLHCTTLFYIALHCSTAPSPSPTAPQVSLKCFTAASVVTPLLTFYVYYTVYIVPPVDFHTRTKLGWKTFSTPELGWCPFNSHAHLCRLPPLQLMPGHFTAQLQSHDPSLLLKYLNNYIFEIPAFSNPLNSHAHLDQRLN